ncbi:hypothetical protein WMF30_04070 [Sorangium sp. So ce134]
MSLRRFVEAPSECQDEEAAAQACIDANGCNDLDCSFSDGPEGHGCGCASTCEGKMHETQCQLSADGTTATCACIVDGVEVERCEGETGEVCGVTLGCCEEVFDNL